MTQIMIFEPDPSERAALRRTLEAGGFQVEELSEIPEVAPAAGSTIGCACLVASADSDLGATLLNRVGEVPVVLISASTDVRRAVSAMKRGAADYLLRPLGQEELVAAVEQCLTRGRGPAGKKSLGATLPMLGRSEPMRDLFARIAKAGPTDSTVLIRGESGTGKELVARALHAASSRSQVPMIALNCATIPSHLIETELFGYHPADAAPGEARSGLLEAANGGTLFLDEIGELSLEAQARLLRVLEAGEVRRLGATESVPVNVRLIAATHRDLDKLARSGQFREDLYYRLNVLTLEIPPLRERGDDVLELALAILERQQMRLGKSGLTFDAGARAAMVQYAWPGNVRELENAIERAIILCDGPAISADLLAIEISEPRPAAAAGAASDRTSLEDYFVSFVLAHQDQMTETELAEKLGISRKSLWERRQRLDIPRKRTRQRGPRRDHG
ncbi:MAG: sigma-54 dependent transcriptional regulator, partial [Pseudomonadales bacterium]